MKKLMANDVTRFIKTKQPDGLRARLSKDFSGPPFRIFRERDLHACCYFHLRRFLQSDRSWEILNEPFLQGLKRHGKGAQPDLVLFRKNKPVFIVELKFRMKHTGIQRKDQHVLRNAVKHKKWAKKAFYIETIIESSQDAGQKVVPYRNKSMTIPMKSERMADYLDLFKRRRRPGPRNSRQN